MSLPVLEQRAAKGACCEFFGEMPLVVGRTALIAGWIAGIGSELCRSHDVVLGWRLAAQSRLGGWGAEVIDPDCRQADPAITDDVAVHADEHARGGDSPSPARRSTFSSAAVLLRTHESQSRSHPVRLRSRMARDGRAPEWFAGRPWNEARLSRQCRHHSGQILRGSAWHRDPPTVPRLRTIGSAITLGFKNRVMLAGYSRLEQLAVPRHRADRSRHPRCEHRRDRDH